MEAGNLKQCHKASNREKHREFWEHHLPRGGKGLWEVFLDELTLDFTLTGMQGNMESMSIIEIIAVILKLHNYQESSWK